MPTIPAKQLGLNAPMAVAIPDQQQGKIVGVNLQVKVADSQIRDSLDQFDGRERPFALLPTSTPHGVTWQRVDLEYQGTDRNFAMGAFGRVHHIEPVDKHSKQVFLDDKGIQ